MTVEGRNKDGCNGQYDQISNALLPQGLNPLSVPPKELAASLGYMVQLLNLIGNKLAAPTLHNLCFGGSCSRIWQRDSYWKSHSSSPSEEYPLFVPSHDHYSIEGQSSWTGSRDTTNFGVASLKSDGSIEDDYHDLDIISLTSSSPHSVETLKNLQRGIANLKQTVAHLTVYGYNSLSMEIPSGSSTTFETFAKLLATLSSIKEVQSALTIGLLSNKQQRHEPNKSVWNMNSSSSSSTLLNSSHIQPTSDNSSYYKVPNRAEFGDVRKDKNSIGEWNFVEHPHSSHQQPNKY